MRVRLAPGKDLLEGILTNAFRSSILLNTYPMERHNFPIREFDVNPLFEDTVNIFMKLFDNKNKPPLVHYQNGGHSSNNLSAVIYGYENGENTVNKMKAVRISYGPSVPDDPLTINRLHLGAFFYTKSIDEETLEPTISLVYCSLRWEGGIFQIGPYGPKGSVFNPPQDMVFDLINSAPHPTRSTYAVSSTEDIPNKDYKKRLKVKKNQFKTQDYIASKERIESCLSARYGPENDMTTVSISDLRRELNSAENQEDITTILNRLAKEGRKDTWFPFSYMRGIDHSPSCPIFGYEHVFDVLSSSRFVTKEDANKITSLDMEQGVVFLEKKLFPAISQFYDIY